MLENGYFSEIDRLGNNRNEGQDKGGRITDGTSMFEIALTAITHEIYRRCLPEITVIPTYHINKFVVFPENHLNDVDATMLHVVSDFMRGMNLRVELKTNNK